MEALVYNDKFEPLFNPPPGVRYFIITGGRFSSKSYSVSTAVATLVNNKEHRALYTRYTLSTTKDSIIPEFEEKLELLGVDDYYTSTQDRIIGPGKRKIVFKGVHTAAGNQTAKLKSLKDFSIFVLDEAEEEHNEANFDTINLSIRASDVPNYVILVLNPTTKTHWIYRRFFEECGVPAGFNGVKDNVCYIHTTYLDAIDFVPADYLREIELMKERNPLKYKHVMLGGWIEKADGVIFNNWEFGAFDHSLPYGFGLDFGFRDPDAMTRVAIDKKQKRIYLKQELYKNGMSTGELAREVKAIVGGHLVVADSAAARSIADLAGYWVNVRPVKKGKIVEDIKEILDWDLIIDPSSADLAKELNNWVWLDKVAEVPLDGFNHLIDSARYYIRNAILPGGGSKGIRKLSYKRKNPAGQSNSSKPNGPAPSDSQAETGEYKATRSYDYGNTFKVSRSNEPRSTRDKRAKSDRDLNSPEGRRERSNEFRNNAQQRYDRRNTRN